MMAEYEGAESQDMHIDATTGYDDQMNNLSGGGFQDGSLADGTGRGDPGRVDPELERLRTENQRLAERTRILEDFEQNPESVIRDAASRLGLDLVPRQGDRRQQGSANQPNSEFLSSLRDNLPPEMQFMADALGQAVWAATQSTLKPLQEQQTNEQMRSRNMERDAIVAEMDSSHPGWRDSLGEMEGLFNFLRDAASGGTMKHPKYGSLQEMLYKLVNGDSQATRTAVNRMRNAAQNASSVSTGGQEGGFDIQKQLNNAKSRQERFKIAFRQALAENGVGR
jgi:hypothetical protein